MAWIRQHEIVIVFVVMAILSSVAVWIVDVNADNGIGNVNRRVTHLCNQFARIKRVEITTAQAAQSRWTQQTQVAIIRLLKDIDCKH